MHTSENAIQTLCGLAVGGMRRLRRGKPTKTMGDAVAADCCAPPFCRGAERHALQLGSVVFVQPGIRNVLRTSRLAQIAPYIVGAVAIAMVQSLAGPFASHVQPREAMGEVLLPINADEHVAQNLVQTPGPFAAPSPLAVGDEPVKMTRCVIIVQYFTQSLCG